MMKKLFLLTLLLFAMFSFSQSGNFWNKNSNTSGEISTEKKTIKNPELYSLDIESLKNLVGKSPKRLSSGPKSSIIVAFPNSEGGMENFRVYKSSNFSQQLQENFPDINSYFGESLNGDSKIYFSISPLGLSTMQLRLGKEAVFIEPFDKKASTYVAYKKSDKVAPKENFHCKTNGSSVDGMKFSSFAKSADDSTLRTYRLALSCTGEYAQYFGGTTALALAAMNNTMTRVNGIFENDFAIRMVLIDKQSNIIFLNPSTDPYSNASTGAQGTWNTELMNVLHGTTYGIGDSAFDIGHLFGATGGGGSAGCIGCVCNNSTTYDSVEQWYWYKGQGFTSPADATPKGDNFDVDYVAHEMGHQFGGNHTFSNSVENTIAQVEPGSGSTIMGYAGITSQDLQPHSDPYFHAVTIQQITSYIKSTSGNCSVNTPTGNNPPKANAGLDYTIPQNTPFMLTGTGSDPDDDPVTYIWEEMDVQNNKTTAPSATKTAGPAFRSYSPSVSPIRYFPNMTTILAGTTKTMGPTTSSTSSPIIVETLSTVNRSLNFRLTVRDNKANGGANNFDDMVVTVNTSYGPFTVTSQNTSGISYAQGSTQTVTWNVANTNTLSPNVDILISTDSGKTWSTLLAATPNDGSQAVTIPNVLSSTCRFMVKGSNHIFFNVNTTNFAIIAPDYQAPISPTLSASGTLSVSTVLSWSGATDNVGVTAYDIYKDGVLIATVTSSPYNVTGLTPSTTYTFTVKAKDASGNVSPESNTVSITTSAPDTQAPTTPTLSASGTTNNSTIITWSGSTDNEAVSGYEIYKDGVLIATVTLSPYTVTGLSPTTTYSFTVKAKDAAGNISPSSNTVSVTTLATPVATELYISEYLEGTSNNKALEISNLTGSTINLANYSIKIARNGAKTWSNVLTLSGNLANNKTYLVTHTSYALNCTGTVNTTTTSLDFNGNDAIALFKGTTLIDIIGTLGSSLDFAKDTNLRRNVSIPNTTYTTSEWNSFAVDTCTNLGTVNPASAMSVNDVSNAKQLILLPNPVKGDVMFVKNAKNKTDFAIYDISGKLISKGQINDETINVRQLSAGVYMIKIGTEVKRFIKQ